MKIINENIKPHRTAMRFNGSVPINFASNVSGAISDIVKIAANTPMNIITHIIKCIAKCSSGLICNSPHYNDAERNIVVIFNKTELFLRFTDELPK